ncbi:MAG: M23 family metallopeptidase [Ignavibacteriales bacterium]|nr:M23 family metallopeptidase [Ignavibacteriales bacterium]
MALTVEKLHHASKKNRYSIVLVPNEDASKARTYRGALWQFVLGVLAVATVIAVSTLALVVYTPLSLYIPITSPELENKYNRELVELNTRMARMMEELVDLRTYNAKLRRAFGENIGLTDSGVVRLRTLEKQERQRGEIQRAVPKRTALEQAAIASSYGEEAWRAAQHMSPPVGFPAMMPAEGYVTRQFQPEQNHTGIDIAGKIGASVVAAADGRVVFSGWTQDYGYVMIISHANGFTTAYKHNQLLTKGVNMFVKRGEMIAALGNTGVITSGPHLHFEIWKDGVPVNPALYVLNLSL